MFTGKKIYGHLYPLKLEGILSCGHVQTNTQVIYANDTYNRLQLSAMFVTRYIYYHAYDGG